MAIGGSALWTLNAGGPLAGDFAQVIEVARPAADAVPWVVSLAPIEKLQSITGTPTTNAGPIDLNTLFDSRALVEWGSGGARQRAVIDWPARGCTFSVHGSYLAVGCAASPLVVVAGGSNVQQVRFTATATIGPGSGQKPTRSIIMGSVAAEAQSLTVDVPPFATEVAMHYTAFDAAVGQQFPLTGVDAVLTWFGSVPAVGQTRYRGTVTPAAAPLLVVGGPYAHDYYYATVPAYAQRFRVGNLQPGGAEEWAMLNVVAEFRLTLY